MADPCTYTIWNATECYVSNILPTTNGETITINATAEISGLTYNIISLGKPDNTGDPIIKDFSTQNHNLDLTGATNLEYIADNACGVFVSSPSDCFKFSYFTGNLFIPKKVQRIGKYAFNLMNFNGTLTFESGSQLTVIDDFAFNSYVQYTDYIFPHFTNALKIPALVTRIGKSAFAYCGFTGNLTFESGSQLTVIDNGAFGGSANYSIFPFKFSNNDLEIPAKVKSIGGACFYNYGGTGKIVFATNSELQTIGDVAFGNLFDKFYQYPNNQSFTQSILYIPSTVQYIGSSPFFNTRIENVVIQNPQNLQTFDVGASLKKIDFQNFENSTYINLILNVTQNISLPLTSFFKNDDETVQFFIQVSQQPANASLTISPLTKQKTLYLQGAVESGKNYSYEIEVDVDIETPDVTFQATLYPTFQAQNGIPEQSNVQNGLWSTAISGNNAVAASTIEGNNGILYSSDSGLTWIMSNVIDGDWYIDISGNNAIACLDSTYTTGIFYSQNAGKTFEQSTITGNVWFVAISETNAVAGSNENLGIIYFKNGGQLWNNSDVIDYSWNVDISGNNAVAGSNIRPGNGIIYSNNGGQSWFESNIKDGTYNVAIDGNNALASGGNYAPGLGILFSNDAGKTWQNSNISSGIWQVNISGNNAIACADNSFFSYGQGIFISYDAGQTWEETSIQNGYWSGSISGNQILLSGYNSGILYFSLTFPCFLKNTKMDMANGTQKCIQDLTEEDSVKSPFSSLPQKVKKVHQRQVHFNPASTNMPFCIAKSFFSENVPSEDVYLSGHHRIILHNKDDNKITGVQAFKIIEHGMSEKEVEEKFGKEFTYYHVELEDPLQHLMVCNMSVESFQHDN